MPTIFLSASVPSLNRAAEFHRGKDSAFEIEQAVVSLARAIFAHHGRLVFGGHPTISPLVSTVAAEYQTPSATEAGRDRGGASVVIYQSEAFRGHAKEDKLLLFRLGLTEVHWTKAVDGEKFDPALPGKGPPCPKSVDAMRTQMLTEQKPDAMVGIGGMEGCLKEVEEFRRLYPERKIFVLASTGGAARILAERREPHVIPIDQQVMEDVNRRRGAGAGEHAAGDWAKQAAPYPLIMQALVEQVWRS